MLVNHQAIGKYGNSSLKLRC